MVAFETFAFYGPLIVASVDGALHLVFYTNTSPSNVRYARCETDCGKSSGWTTTTVGSGQFAGSTRLVVGTDNRLHLVYQTSATGSPQELVYATCATNCTQATSWTKTILTSLFGGWTSPTHGSPLVIDAQNRLSFTVDRSIYLNGGLHLATCAASCSTLGNWSVGLIRNAGTRTALAASGTTLHQLVDNATPTNAATVLTYRTCSANCTQAASWQETPSLFFAYGGSTPIALVATAQGGVRIVYNQGVSDVGQPAAVKLQDNKMLYWACDSNCLQAASWSGLIMGAVNDGKDGIRAAQAGTSTVLAISNGDKVFAKVCTQSCLMEANWQSALIDNSASWTATYDPYTYAICGTAAPTVATWNLAHPGVAIRPDGAAAFALSAHVLRTCPGTTAVEYLPGFGRVVFVP